MLEALVLSWCFFLFVLYRAGRKLKDQEQDLIVHKAYMHMVLKDLRSNEDPKKLAEQVEIYLQDM